MTSSPWIAGALARVELAASRAQRDATFNPLFFQEPYGKMWNRAVAGVAVVGAALGSFGMAALVSQSIVDRGIVAEGLSVACGAGFCAMAGAWAGSLMADDILPVVAKASGKISEWAGAQLDKNPDLAERVRERALQRAHSFRLQFFL